MEGKMKAAVMTDIQKLEIEERPIPQIKPNEVLVKLDYCGICGSDMHFFEYGKIGTVVIKPPRILGHEPGGTVVEVGSEVSHLHVGDKVAVEPGVPCGKCETCRQGLYNLCDNVKFYGTSLVDGAFCEYIAHDANYVWKLPEGVSTLEGALVEPLAVGLQAVRQGGAHAGQTAVVLGSGCIGLCTMLSLKIVGVNTIYVVDIVDSRLQKAMELGATGVINGKECDAVQKILELTGGKGADIVLETAGTEITTNQAIHMTKRGCTVVLVGNSASGHMDFDTFGVIHNELTIKSVYRYRNCYPVAIEALAAGKIDLKGVATNLFKFEDIQSAMEQSITDKQHIIKSVIQF